MYSMVILSLTDLENELTPIVANVRHRIDLPKTVGTVKEKGCFNGTDDR